jgi:hypothetical protein
MLSPIASKSALICTGPCRLLRCATVPFAFGKGSVVPPRKKTVRAQMGEELEEGEDAPDGSNFLDLVLTQMGTVRSGSGNSAGKHENSAPSCAESALAIYRKPSAAADGVASPKRARIKRAASSESCGGAALKTLPPGFIGAANKKPNDKGAQESFKVRKKNNELIANALTLATASAEINFFTMVKPDAVKRLVDELQTAMKPEQLALLSAADLDDEWSQQMHQTLTQRKAQTECILTVYRHYRPDKFAVADRQAAWSTSTGLKGVLNLATKSSGGELRFHADVREEAVKRRVVECDNAVDLMETLQPDHSSESEHADMRWLLSCRLYTDVTQEVMHVKLIIHSFHRALKDQPGVDGSDDTLATFVSDARLNSWNCTDLNLITEFSNVGTVVDTRLRPVIENDDHVERLNDALDAVADISNRIYKVFSMRRAEYIVTCQKLLLDYTHDNHALARLQALDGERVELKPLDVIALENSGYDAEDSLLGKWISVADRFHAQSANVSDLFKVGHKSVLARFRDSFEGVHAAIVGHQDMTFQASLVSASLTMSNAVTTTPDGAVSLEDEAKFEDGLRASVEEANASISTDASVKLDKFGFSECREEYADACVHRSQLMKAFGDGVPLLARAFAMKQLAQSRRKAADRELTGAVSPEQFIDLCTYLDKWRIACGSAEASEDTPGTEQVEVRCDLTQACGFAKVMPWRDTVATNVAKQCKAVVNHLSRLSQTCVSQKLSTLAAEPILQALFHFYVSVTGDGFTPLKLLGEQNAVALLGHNVEMSLLRKVEQHAKRLGISFDTLIQKGRRPEIQVHVLGAGNEVMYHTTRQHVLLAPLFVHVCKGVVSHFDTSRSVESQHALCAEVVSKQAPLPKDFPEQLLSAATNMSNLLKGVVGSQVASTLDVHKASAELLEAANYWVKPGEAAHDDHLKNRALHIDVTGLCKYISTHITAEFSSLPYKLLCTLIDLGVLAAAALRKSVDAEAALLEKSKAKNVARLRDVVLKSDNSKAVALAYVGHMTMSAHADTMHTKFGLEFRPTPPSEPAVAAMDVKVSTLREAVGNGSLLASLLRPLGKKKDGNFEHRAEVYADELNKQRKKGACKAASEVLALAENLSQFVCPADE